MKQRCCTLTLAVALMPGLFPARAAEAPRPSPQTIQEWQARKFGMFIHWGLYSIAGGVWNGERVTDIYSEQIMGRGHIPKQEYAALAAQFNPEKWDPDAVAELAKAAGMKFIVLTAKHHDGFNMFATKMTKFNVVDATPYHKDVVKGLAEACARHGLKFGVYYSTIDWNYPLATGPDMPRNNNPIPEAHADFNVAQIKELASSYGPLTEVWFDMGNPTPSQSERFANAVHERQPQSMVSGRVFNHQGDFTVMPDNMIPQFVIDEPWQTPGSIYSETWGYRSWQKRTDAQGKTNEHISKLVEVVSRGGNYLLNVGPRGDGSIVEFEAEVLRGVGKWLEVNGDAIYGSQPQPFRKLDFGFATVSPGRLNLMVRDWPEDGVLKLPGLRTSIRKAYFLADQKKLPLRVENGPAGASVHATSGVRTPPVTVVVAEYNGTLEVTPPTIPPQSGGQILLRADAADKFLNFNGRGYYEPPSTYKMEWHFTVTKTGLYQVAGLPAGCAADVDGKAVGADGAVQISARAYHTLTIATPKPFVKGDRLKSVPEQITLTPIP